ncbi:MAG: sodium:proton antiporter [Acidobacteria bacterium]|nr:sodium:proton antiporter [Acidobacteriota bacterium]
MGSFRSRFLFFLTLIVAAVLVPSTAAAAEGGSAELGASLPLWSVIPFAGILLSIAIFPLVAGEFWHHHFGKVSAGWALLFAVPFLLAYRGEAIHEILHIYIIDYIPFIILLWALFTVAGGILIRGSFNGTPGLNTVFLLIGTLIASWVGTTGAAMLLIRPVIRANARRQHKVHTIVFFIFLVANIGGSLTPLGDPPLFLGFLHGVPFFWTFRIIPETVTVAAILLVLYFILDSIFWRRETLAARQPHDGPQERLKIEGLHNLLFLGGILGGVLLSGMWHAGTISVFGVEQQIQNFVRDGLLILMGVLSVVTTSKKIRTDNAFSWFPIQEVAYLFAGIFMTIVPALAILRAGEHGALAGLIAAVRDPAHYFWVTGGLSSFLDNAPTYLTFFNSALGRFFPGTPEHLAVHSLIGHQEEFLRAISTGAVYMGANTYIGNAPNFMVKSIAEENGVEMPSFFGYMLRYSLPILIPVFILVTVIFFMGA